MATTKRPRKGGAKPATLARLRDKNEERHQAALAAGSPWALDTERRRQRVAATAADAAAQGATPPVLEAATPPPDPPQGDAGGARPTMARRLWREGLTALIRPPRSS